jgi:hypothetical protein
MREMNTKRIDKNGRALRSGIAIGAVLLGSAVCAAAQNMDVSNALTNADNSGISELVSSFAQEHPWASTTLLVIGGLRVVFKPAMSLLGVYIKSNCASEEYAKFQKIESGAALKWLSFALDLLCSIKLSAVAAKPSASSNRPKSS